MMAVLKNNVVGATKESFPLCRCPKCRKTGVVDLGQFRGLVSMICPSCDFHETINWELLDSSDRISSEYSSLLKLLERRVFR